MSENSGVSVEESASERVARVIFAHAAAISMQRDVGTLLQLNADLARDLLGADRCSVWLLDERTQELWTKVAHGVSEIRIPLQSGLAGACFQSNEIVLVNDLAADERFYRTVDSSSGYVTTSALCVPLQAEGAPIGVLQVLNKADGFTQEDAEVLRLMSIYSASAIQSERLRQLNEGARLLRRELDIAASVQQRLLPQLAGKSDRLEYAGFCRPASTVGGDFYDLIHLDDGSVGITLGDVAGKGFPAAVLMASIHTLLRHLLMQGSSDLAKTLTELNRTVHLSSSAERYATLFCGVLSSDGRRLDFINAGHVPPLIVRASDGTIFSEQRGEMPLGLMPGTRYTRYTLDLQAGDLLVCMSDGIMEAEDAAGNSIDPMLVQTNLVEARHRPVAEIVEQLVTAVDAYAGVENQFDDMTLVAMRV